MIVFGAGHWLTAATQLLLLDCSSAHGDGQPSDCGSRFLLRPFDCVMKVLSVSWDCRIYGIPGSESRSAKTGLLPIRFQTIIYLSIKHGLLEEQLGTHYATVLRLSSLGPPEKFERDHA